MATPNIQKVVLDALKEIQVLSGREWISLSDTAKPISALPGFDSGNGIEVTCLVEQVLEQELPIDENICVEDLGGGKRRARTLKEIVDRVGELLATVE